MGVFAGTLFRSKLGKELYDHPKLLNRTPAHALNIMLGTSFFRSMLDLVMSNRTTGAKKGGYAVTQFLLDGGVSCLGLESNTRFPYMRADGGFDSVQIRRLEKLSHS